MYEFSSSFFWHFLVFLEIVLEYYFLSHSINIQYKKKQNKNELNFVIMIAKKKAIKIIIIFLYIFISHVQMYKEMLNERVVLLHFFNLYAQWNSF